MAEPQNTPQRILCVGADTPTRQLLDYALPESNLSVVGSAFEALRAINERPYDAYMVECWLPDLTGAALCRDIRKADPHAPILFFTDAGREVEQARGLRAGASAYICKPLDPDVLRSTIKSLLSRALVESLNARVEEERAIQSELQRQLAHVQARLESASQLKAASVERIARARAYKAFMEARGTRARFESWWPQLFWGTQMAFQRNHPSEDA